MTRKKSHFQGKEPILEAMLQKVRLVKIKPFIFDKAKVLDLGCGYNAPLIRHFSGQISEGVGVDISVGKSEDKIKLLASPLDQRLKIPENHFDLAISLAVTEHLKNPLPMYKSAFKSLKPKGKFLLTTPSPAAKPILEFLAFRLGLLSKQEISDHKKYYTVMEIRNLLKSAGFKPKNIRVSTFSLGLNTFAVAKK